jgi:hypothetical protein
MEGARSRPQSRVRLFIINAARFRIRWADPRCSYRERGCLRRGSGRHQCLSSSMASRYTSQALATGPAQNVAESVFAGDISFSATAGGLLLYQRHLYSQLTWLDSNGNKISTIGSPGLISMAVNSPDGKRAMVPVEDSRQRKLKLWLYDLIQGTASPFTFGDSSDNYPRGRQTAKRSPTHHSA